MFLDETNSGEEIMAPGGGGVGCTADVNTALRSEVAGLRFKRDRLLAEVQELRGQLHCRDERITQLESETDQLRELTARHGAVMAAQRQRIADLEPRELDLARRVAVALTGDEDIAKADPDVVVQDAARLRARNASLADSLAATDRGLRRAHSERDEAESRARDLSSELRVAAEARARDQAERDAAETRIHELMAAQGAAERDAAESRGRVQRLLRSLADVLGCTAVSGDLEAVVFSRTREVCSEIILLRTEIGASKRDKCTFIEFMERLRNALGLESPEPGEKVPTELLTEALLRRAEHLSRIESDGLVENVFRFPPPGRRALSPPPTSLPMLSPIGETAAVHQLQRRIRALKEQLQRRDLHLDLLRRKLTLQADDATAATARLRRRIECLSAQLSSAADYKLAALERGRRVTELQQESSAARAALADAARNEAQLAAFRAAVAKLTGTETIAPDTELLARLQRLVAAQRDLAVLSRRYEDTITPLPPPILPPPGFPPPTPPPPPPPRPPRLGTFPPLDSEDLLDYCRRP